MLYVIREFVFRSIMFVGYVFCRILLPIILNSHVYVLCILCFIISHILHIMFYYSHTHVVNCLWQMNHAFRFLITASLKLTVIFNYCKSVPKMHSMEHISGALHARYQG
jgi:hypothetical protein